MNVKIVWKGCGSTTSYTGVSKVEREKDWVAITQPRKGGGSVYTRFTVKDLMDLDVKL